MHASRTAIGQQCVVVMAFSAGAVAQDAKGSPAHIRAVTSAIDGNSIRANAATSKDWPAVGLDYGETRFSKLDQINTDNVKKLGLVWSYNLDSTRGVEATPLVVDGIMYVTRLVERRARHRRPHRQEDLDLRSRSVAREGLPGLLRRGQPRRGALQGQGLRRYLRRPPDRARRGHRQEGLGEGHHHRPLAVLHHHRRAARLQGQGDHRQRRRRIWRARLRHRLRRRDRQPGLALVHGAGRSGEALRGRRRWPRPPRPGTPPASTGRPAAAARRGTRITFDPELNLDLYRHRQRLALEPAACAARPAATTSTSPRSSRSNRRHRQVPLALPGDARRQLGLHVDPADDPRRPQDRRRAAQGDHAGAEERLLLRHRSHQRQVHLGQELRRRELGDRLRRRTAGRSRCAEARSPDKAVRHHSRALTAPQLASDVVQSHTPGSSTCRRRTYRST